VDRVTKKLVGRRRLKVRLIDGASKKQLELRPGCAELRRWRKRKIELEAAWEQKDPINGGTGSKIEQLRRVELLPDVARPVREHVSKRGAIGDREAKIEIGPAVSLRERKGAYPGACDDSRIRGCKLKGASAQALPICHGEHCRRACLTGPR